MFAAQAGPDDTNALVANRLRVAELIILHCPDAVYIKDKHGKDAFLHACACGTLSVIKYLITIELPEVLALSLEEDFPDSPVTALAPSVIITARQYHIRSSDNAGNSPLHLAAAAGELKTVRLLIDLGADEKVVNAAGWRPAAYSASVSAEVYLKGLVREREANKVLGNIERAVTGPIEKRRGQVRVVAREDND